MRFLITNDDGIDAEGLAALSRAAGELGEVVVVAPDRGWSGCGHQTTIDEPLTVNDHDGGRHSTNGTPADCVRLGLRFVAENVDWVLSGVNHGGNLGIDTAMSGTVAAAREAVQHGVPAIAFSQFLRGGHPGFDWSVRTELLRSLLESLIARDLRDGWLWNVNLPDPGDEPPPGPTIVDCPIERGHHAFDFDHVDGAYHYRSRYDQRTRSPGTDVDVCFGGAVAVSLLPAVWSNP